MSTETIGPFRCHDLTATQRTRVQAAVDNCTFPYSLVTDNGGLIDLYFQRIDSLGSWGQSSRAGWIHINPGLTSAQTQYTVVHELAHHVARRLLNASERAQLNALLTPLRPDLSWEEGSAHVQPAECYADQFTRVYAGASASWVSGNRTAAGDYYRRKFTAPFDNEKTIIEGGTPDDGGGDPPPSNPPQGVVEFSPTKDVAQRKNIATAAHTASGGEQHLPLGRYIDSNGPDFIYTALIQFDLVWPENCESIDEAYLELSVLADPLGTTHLQNSGDKSVLQASLVTGAWTEGNNGEGVWDASDYVNPAKSTTLRTLGAVGAKATGTRLQFDILPFIAQWAPATIRVGTYGPGKGVTNRGLFLRVARQDITNGATEFASRDHGTDAYKPNIYVAYTPTAVNPVAEALAPTGSIGSNIFDFTGSYADPLSRDTMGAFELQVRKVGGSNVWTPATFVADASASATGLFLMPSTAAPVNTWQISQNYEWRCRVQSEISGKWSDWTDWLAFLITNAAPTVTATALGSKATLDHVYFGGPYTNPGGMPVVNCQLQLRPEAEGDPAWADDFGFLWDTGEQALTADETSQSKVRRLYTGQDLVAGAYTYRVRVQDNGGAWSNWSYATLTLTVGFEPDPGATEFLSGYGTHRFPVRVVIRDMGTNRGPHDVKALIYDPTNLGFSTVANDIGEFYFTIPTTHPQASEIEPLQRHYSVEFWRAGQWRAVAEGLITDMDATEDDVVFYGLDYMGLLSKSIETAFYDWDSPEASIDNGGAKYIDKNISYIIKDQLSRAKAETDSVVGFINVEAQGSSTLMEAISEKVSIHAEFRERLQFILGLIQSAKQGTGKRSRLWPEKASSGSYRWRYKTNAGTTRDNLRLKYGELVQGFRLVLLGQWAAKVYGVGRVTNETKLRFKSATAPGIDTSIWGNIQMAAIWQDLIDENDLARRVKQMAMEMGKFGKSVALGLRVSGLGPFDGYDLMDSIPVEIIRGAVDTTRYGSGYWTILGVEYRLFPDGHDELTLAIKPREDSTPPDDDLIPSRHISNAQEWQRQGLVGANLAGDTTARIREDGTSSPLVSATWDAITADNFGTWAVQVARNATGDFSAAPVYTAPESAIEIEDLAPSQDYSIRVGAFDATGHFSGYSTHITVTAASDPDAPAVPANLDIVPSIRSLLIEWDAVSDADLAFYQVQWKETADADWFALNTKATSIAITGLSVSEYEVQVRSVDLTNNTSAWSASAFETPLFVVGADVADGAIGTLELADGAVTNPKVDDDAIDEPNIVSDAIRARHILAGQIETGHITTAGLNANVIKTGTLSVGATGNPPDFIVYDSLGREIVHFDEAGALFTDATDTLRMMRWSNGVLEFSDDGGSTWETAINADGITASAIRVGVAPGGHNMIPNSSFENLPFNSPATKVWTAAGDWGTTIGSDVNVDKSTGDLKLGSVTY